MSRLMLAVLAEGGRGNPPMVPLLIAPVSLTLTDLCLRTVSWIVYDVRFIDFKGGLLVGTNARTHQTGRHRTRTNRQD
ncbi:MAG: hypothetical protein ACREDR_34840, partial [Blastocatellia bacterium]